MARFDKFLYGFIPGLILPVLFMWLYISEFYPGDFSFVDAVKQLYPSVLFGKLLLLSVMPNLGLVFVFYKSDCFKIASGLLLSAMPYFIGCLALL